MRINYITHPPVHNNTNKVNYNQLREMAYFIVCFGRDLNIKDVNVKLGSKLEFHTLEYYKDLFNELVRDEMNIKNSDDLRIEMQSDGIRVYYEAEENKRNMHYFGGGYFLLSNVKKENRVTSLSYGTFSVILYRID
jgi:hypothetical protein